MKSLFVSALATTLCWAAPAKAQESVCVAIDESRDQLSDEQRIAARQLLENELMVSEAKVAECPHPYLVSHVLLGGKVHVLLRTEGKSYTATTDSLATISGAYAALIRDSQPKASPQPIESQPIQEDEYKGATKLAPQAEARRESEAVPEERESATSSFYARVGYAISPAIQEQSQGRQGATLGVGYRRNYGKWILDISAANVLIERERVLNGDRYKRREVTVPSIVRVSGYYRASPTESGSFYGGGGASVGQAFVRYTYRNRLTPSEEPVVSSEAEFGLQGELVAGWELAPTDSLRLFVEANLTLPLGGVLVEFPDVSDRFDEEERFWAPTAAFTAGLGF